jgi:hypothetical protein
MAGCGGCANDSRADVFVGAGGGRGARNAGSVNANMNGGTNRNAPRSFTMMDARIRVTGGSTSPGVLALDGKTIRQLGIVNQGVCEPAPGAPTVVQDPSLDAIRRVAIERADMAQQRASELEGVDSAAATQLRLAAQRFGMAANAGSVGDALGLMDEGFRLVFAAESRRLGR